MSAKHGAADHHASAATHHNQAARHHREASKHYLIGKDYAHAAHQALAAHGHALQAFEHSHEASRFYAEQGGSVWPIHPEPVLHLPPLSIDDAGPVPPTGLGSAAHHDAAADHHEQAARHHGQAARHRGGNEVAQAAQDARIAYDHAQRSVFHGNEAAKHHVEHYGRSGPTAELA